MSRDTTATRFSSSEITTLDVLDALRAKRPRPCDRDDDRRKPFGLDELRAIMSELLRSAL